MLKFYIESLKFVWTWTKKFLLAITVLLPGIIFLIYMFAANMPDVGIIPGLLCHCRYCTVGTNSSASVLLSRSEID